LRPVVTTELAEQELFNELRGARGLAPVVVRRGRRRVLSRVRLQNTGNDFLQALQLVLHV
jgi:hypothetical protein